MTKPKPGAKRGRPQKPKSAEPPKRGKGRPPKGLRLQPWRFAVACLDANTILGASGRLAAEEVVGAREMVGSEDRSLAQQRMDRELRKSVERFRVTARRYDTPDDMGWREATSEAIINTFIVAVGGKDLWWINAEKAIVGRAAFVGEDAWARRVLLPLTELDLTKATPDLAERAERVHRLTFPPDKCDDEWNDNLVRDFVNDWVSELKQRPDAPLDSNLESWPQHEIEIMGKVIKFEIVLLRRLLSPGPYVTRMIAKKRCDPN